MTRRRTLLLAPVAVVTAGAVAFVGYGAHSRSGEVSYARGGVAFGAGDAAAPPAVPRASATARPATSRTASSAPAARAAAEPVAVSRSAEPSTPRTRRSAAPAAVAPSAAPRAAATQERRVPVPGTYRVRTTGSERVRFGPVSFCGRDFPASGSWVVSRAAGESPTSYVLDQRLFPGSPGQHDERHLYRYDGDRVLLDFEQATVTCAGQRQSTDVTFSPAQLRVRGPVHVGDTWTSTGGDAERTEDARSRVLRVEQVRIGDRTVRTLVVETHVAISGSESGDRTQRWWWAPSLALPVRVQESITASRSGGAYTSTLDSTVVSLPAGA